MAETTAEPKRRGKGLFLGLAAALVLGAGGFAATFLGLVHLPVPGGHATQEHGSDAMPDITFLPIDQITISLGPEASARHLLFTGQLEVPVAQKDAVSLLLPRVRDVLNSYLRAVDAAMLADPATLPKLKAQMLRRILIVTGEGRVNDLLISDFVLN